VQTAPVRNPRIIAAKLEDNGSGSAVEEVYAALSTLTPDKEAAHSAARNAHQAIFAILEGEEDQVHQSLGAALQVPAKAEEPLAVAAERIESDRNWSAIGPQNLVAFVVNLFLAAIAARITAKENFQNSCHAQGSLRPIKGYFR